MSPSFQIARLRPLATAALLAASAAATAQTVYSTQQVPAPSAPNVYSTQQAPVPSAY